MAGADVHLVARTDAPTIPGLVPGFSLQQDLHALERAGLFRYQVLVTATRAETEPFGTIAPGNRADLILSGGNPLEDLSTLEKPIGVMARGHWYSASELRSLLEEVAKNYETR